MVHSPSGRSRTGDGQAMHGTLHFDAQDTVSAPRSLASVHRNDSEDERLVAGMQPQHKASLAGSRTRQTSAQADAGEDGTRQTCRALDPDRL